MSICKVENFYDAIAKYKSIHSVTKRCLQEKEYLENACGSISSLKKYLTKYRQFLIANVNELRLVEGEPLIRIILKHLKLSKEQQYQFTKDQQDKVYSDKSNLRDLYSVDDYVNKAVSLLSSISVYDNILGLAALTGRRTAEIGCTATFLSVEGNNLAAIFDGQLKIKKHEAIKPYEIPLLYNFNVIRNALDKVRKAKPEFINNQAKFNAIASKELSIRVKKHFTGLLEGIPQAKDLRSIYALICFSEFSKNPANRKTDRAVFMSRILGHREKDVITYGSYIDFCLT